MNDRLVEYMYPRGLYDQQLGNHTDEVYYLSTVMQGYVDEVSKRKKLLWLDDLRNPFLDIEGRVPKVEAEIHWVLNYDEFVMWIEKFGMPDIVSFDHDIHQTHYTPEEYWSDYEASKKYQEAQNYTEKTGMDCAKWLVEYCMDNIEDLPEFYVHSANPPGADNIRGLLENFKKNFNKNLD